MTQWLGSSATKMQVEFPAPTSGAHSSCDSAPEDLMLSPGLRTHSTHMRIDIQM